MLWDMTSEMLLTSRLCLATLLMARTAAITVQIDDGHVINTLPAGFASVTLDFHPGTQGAVWGSNASILEINLTSPGLLGVARALAPAVLRLGGSEAGENVTYVNFPGLSAPCPASYYYCLTRSRWDEILAFASTTGLRLMLDLNIIGPAHSNDWAAGIAQIDALLAYTASANRHTPWAFELGNENQATLSPQEAAKRVTQVHRLLAIHWPDRATRPLLVGPSVHIEPDWIADFLGALPVNSTDAPGRPPLDIFAYHMYAGYGRAPNVAHQVPTTAFLDDARGLVDTAAAAVRFAGGGSARPSAASALPLLVSETAAAWASGGPTGACVSFASSLWYFDHLAHAASSIGGGHVAVARQTLVGGNYSLVDSNHRFAANPDYFVALLWRMVVEGGASRAVGAPAAASSTRVLRATRPPVIAEDTHRELRSFAACDPLGRLVVGVANVGDEAASVIVQLASGPTVTEQPRDEWVLTSGGANATDMLSRSVKLNNQPVASVGGFVPPLPPRRSESTDPFHAPPLSVAFLRFAHVPAACAPSYLA